MSEDIYIFNAEDSSKRKMIEEIRKDYKILLAAFERDGKLAILFENVDEEDRFKQEYSQSLDFIKILTKGSIFLHRIA